MLCGSLNILPDASKLQTERLPMYCFDSGYALWNIKMLYPTVDLAWNHNQKYTCFFMLNSCRACRECQGKGRLDCSKLDAAHLRCGVKCAPDWVNPNYVLITFLSMNSKKSHGISGGPALGLNLDPKAANPWSTVCLCGFFFSKTDFSCNRLNFTHHWFIWFI